MSPFNSTPGGSNVREIQRALNKAGGSTQPLLVEDGILGVKTKARIIEFQRSRRLAPDGIVGALTRAALGLPPGPVSAPGKLPLPGAVGSPTSVVATVVAATKEAFQTWKFTAAFRNITINGPVAIGAPGCLFGPDFAGLINSRVGSLQNDSLAIARAAATGIGKNFTMYQNLVSVPGLPWYPSFAAVPSTSAPPTPSVPSPLIALISAGFMGITTELVLRNAMEQAAGRPLVSRSGSAFSEIASQCASFFFTAIGTTLVARVMGTGPVPGFAPPMIPVSPVVGGRVITTPGIMS